MLDQGKKERNNKPQLPHGICHKPSKNKTQPHIPEVSDPTPMNRFISARKHNDNDGNMTGRTNETPPPQKPRPENKQKADASWHTQHPG
jgi:hypothetical protein